MEQLVVNLCVFFYYNTKEPQSSLLAIEKTIASNRSFAQTINNICDIILSQLDQPIIKGDRIAITYLKLNILQD